MSKKETLASKRLKLLHRIVDCGWQPDIELIEKRMRKELFELTGLIFGEYEDSNYFISPDKDYRLILDKKWLKLLGYKKRHGYSKEVKLGTWPVGSIMMTEKGFAAKKGITFIEVVLPEKEKEYAEEF